MRISKDGNNGHILVQDMETSRYLGQDIIDTLGILCRTYVINTSIYLVQDIIDTSSLDI